MTTYKTPGVYIEEIPKLPPSIAQVETAVPVFIGYTENAFNRRGEEQRNFPLKITSMLEYENFFGGPLPEPQDAITVNIKQNSNGTFEVNGSIDITKRSPYLMYYSIQWFFINGGGECYIVSVGDYSTVTVDTQKLLDGLGKAEQVNEITLILFPDAVNLSNAANYYNLYGEAMDQCVLLKDRFVIMDVWIDTAFPITDIDTHVDNLRNNTPADIDTIKYAAAYFPPIETNLDYQFASNAAVKITGAFPGNLEGLKGVNNALYNRALQAIRDIALVLPPSSGIAGIYANVDDTRGVWKAPANVSLDFVIQPVIKLTDKQQAGLNVDETAGKSINVIRSFPGRGAGIVWGARTLAGNDNEWRYVPVRRFFNMVEESVKNGTMQFVFEPNDKNTWTRVKSMIENFLLLQWRAGALMGTTPEQAFYVKVGINETMTELDIWEGRMIVEIGMAVVRPAEFIILKFSHKMLSES